MLAFRASNAKNEMCTYLYFMEVVAVVVVVFNVGVVISTELASVSRKQISSNPN